MNNKYLLGKIALYFLNAYNDAFIAQELLPYLNGDKSKLKLKSKRAVEYINNYHTHAELAGIAYTQYYWNGLFDYMYAKLLFKILPKDKQSEFTQYLEPIIQQFKKEIGVQKDFSEFPNRPAALMFRMLIQVLFMIPYRWRFQKSLPTDLKVKRREYPKQMIYVQNTNIANNYKQMNQLSVGKETTIKQKYIHKLAKHFENPTEFLEGIKETLIAASDWDILFKKYIGIRYFLNPWM